jgi:hypothetical protein
MLLAPKKKWPQTVHSAASGNSCALRYPSGQRQHAHTVVCRETGKRLIGQSRKDISDASI